MMMNPFLLKSSTGNYCQDPRYFFTVTVKFRNEENILQNIKRGISGLF